MTIIRPWAVLFDLDGTLIDTIGLLLECARHTFKGRTPAPTDEEWIAGIGTPLRKQFAAYTTSDDEVEELTQRYRSFQREHHDRLTTAFPGVLEVLDELEAMGHPMGIVTSKSNEMMDRGLEWVGIMRHMKTRIGMDNAKRHKPDPHPVQVALEELEYEPGEAVFVGDSPHDIASGNAAGVTTVAALWGPFSREQLEPYHPSHYLENITALPRLIETIQRT
ncbi:MAG TPA: HAD-IA family hydrolase [Gemmatimonadaceae bacterium]|jgi:pyrophosphatase PpaX|nr:HAD-IA family hydrolase [Gemmatimonadaceae bacterium]